DPELFGHPGDHRLLKHAPRVRERGHRRPENPVELEERLFEEYDEVQVRAADLAGMQAEVDRAFWEAAVVLLSAEPLFLSGGRQDSILEECGTGIVEEAGDAENIHQNCLLASTVTSSLAAVRSSQPAGAPTRSSRGSEKARITSAKGPRM